MIRSVEHLAGALWTDIGYYLAINVHLRGPLTAEKGRGLE
jgi:hypothetical protein